jgi:hypothetical protein
MKARRALGATLALAGVLSGCGGVRAADLFIVSRTGPTSGRQLTVLVNEEGGVRCNGARAPRLSDPLLVQARAIEEETQEAAGHHLSLPARPGSVYAYVLREEHGTVRFADNSPGQPAVLRHLQLFVLQVAQDVCRLRQ